MTKPDFKRSVQRSLRHNGLVVSALFAGMVIAGATATTDSPNITPSIDEHPGQALIDKHGCWTADESQPKDVWIPGHAVVSGGPDGYRYAGQRVTHQALEGNFQGTVYAYCR